MPAMYALAKALGATRWDTPIVGTKSHRLPAAGAVGNRARRSEPDRQPLREQRNRAGIETTREKRNQGA